MTGGFQSVVHVLESHLSELGLEDLGRPGETFDPQQHEALIHENADDVDHPTCTRVLRRGYRVGSHLLRPAQVAVADPGPSQSRSHTDA